MKSVAFGRRPVAASDRPLPSLVFVTYWGLTDPLVQTYVLPYILTISRILPGQRRLVLLTFETELSISEESEIGAAIPGLEVVRSSYSFFGVRAFVRVAFALLRLARTIGMARPLAIHCFGTPAGSLGVLLSQAYKVPLVLDSYEPHAEAMVENGQWNASSLRFHLLSFLEWWQTRRAAVAIGTTAAMRDYATVRYGRAPANFFAKPACVSVDDFPPREDRGAVRASLEIRHDDVVCIYVGKFGGIYLTREVFEFAAVASAAFCGAFKLLVLTPTPTATVDDFREEAGLAPTVTRIVGRVPPEAVPSYLAAADFALNPVKPVPTKRYCTSIKDGEYWAAGLPVVITQGISDDSEMIVSQRIGALIESLDARGYAAALCVLRSLLNGEERTLLAERIRSVAKEHRSFSIAEGVYDSIYGVRGVICS